MTESVAKEQLIREQAERERREAERASYSQPDHLFPLTNRVSWQSYFVNAPENMSFLNRGDYDKYLLALADYPRYNEEKLALLREALARD